jgi:hypothetical protein
MSLILGILDSGAAGGGGGGASYESIATINVGSGGSSSITFSSIPSTYTHLQLRMMGKSSYSSGGEVNLAITFNSDTNNNNYSSHALRGDGSSASAIANVNGRGVFWYVPVSSDNGWAVAVVDILDYANTNKYKTVRNLTGFDNNGNGNIRLTSVNWRSLDAITSINLPSEPLFTQYSQFALYGIKGS